MADVGSEARPAGSPGPPRISVVIPSTGRPTLHQAVSSALDQTLRPAQVIVVFDLAQVPGEFHTDDPRVRHLVTGGGQGANRARRLGAEAAGTEAVALLDDDDYWFAEKLERQAELFLELRGRGFRPVITSGLQLVTHDGAAIEVVPRRLLGAEQSVADYLFKRREIPWGEATIGSSSLLIDRSLLIETPFDDTLALHEDWDWLLRVSRLPDVRVAMAPGPQYAYRQPAPGQRFSRSVHWRSSVAWAERERGRLTRREYGDFLLTVTVGLAVDAGARRGACAVAGRALLRGRPGLAAVVAAAGLLLLPRSFSLIALRAGLRARTHTLGRWARRAG